MNFDLFGVGVQSRSAVMTAQRRINCHYEVLPDEDGRGTRVVVLGTPGLDLFVDFGDTPVRASFEKGDLLYMIHRGTLWEVNNAGTKTVLGTLSTTTGRCYMADNGLQLMIVDSAHNGYTYRYSTGVLSTIADLGFPGALNVAWQDGFFIVPEPDSGRFAVSAFKDGQAWPSTAFKAAESNPDGNMLVLVLGGMLIIFGTKTTEFYTNSGVGDNPFTRIQGSTLQWGLAAKHSAVKWQGTVMALFRSDMGQMIVAKLNGYQAERVSTSDLEAIMRKYPTVADATAFAYMIDGHAFYQLNFPTANASWLYDGLSQGWSELQSGDGRHRAEMHVSYLDRNIVTDYENGRVYRINPETYTDNGAPIRRLLSSKHLYNSGLPITVDEVRLFFETGVGLALGQGVDPTIMLRASKTSGRRWGPEKRKSLGAIGEYRKRVIFSRFGQAEDFVFELAMTDPVKFCLVGEALEIEAVAVKDAA